MPATAGAHTGRSASMGTLLALGAGLALYQMTSLVLGPGGSRQLPVSLNIPAVDVEDALQPALPNVNLSLGTLAAPASPALASPRASHRALIASSQRSSVATPVSALHVPTPSAAPTPRPITMPTPSPSPAPQPPLRPTPPVEPKPVPSGD